MKAVVKHRKALLLLSSLVALAACLPQPDDPIEFLRREESIIVQVKVVNDAESAFEQLLTTPEVTLYGNGTLIVIDGEAGLVRAHVGDGEIQDLLEHMEGKGFFDFNYHQPDRAGPVTYVFGHSKLAQNAVRACGLGEPAPDGGEWSQVRRLQDVRERLDAIVAEALEGNPQPYRPEEVAVVVEREIELREPVGALDAAELNEIAPRTGVPGERKYRLDEMPDLAALRGGGGMAGAVFAKKSGAYVFGMRPVLPFEENFPEFDLPPEGSDADPSASLRRCGRG
jgi:hypothetical protein